MGLEGGEPGALSEGLGYAAQGLGTLANLYSVGSALYEGDYAGAAMKVAPQAIQAGAGYAAQNTATLGAEAAAAGQAISKAIPVVNIIAAVESGRQMGGDIDEQYKNRSVDEQFMSSPGAQAGTGHLGDIANRYAPDSPLADMYRGMGKLEDKYVGEVVDKTFNAGYSFVSKLFGGPGSSNPATPMGQAYDAIPTLEQVKQGITGGQYGTWNLNSPDMIYLKENADKVPSEVWNMNIDQYISWFRGQVQSNPEVKKFYQDVRQYTDPYMASATSVGEGYFAPVTTFGAYDDWVGAYQPPAPPPRDPAGYYTWDAGEGQMATGWRDPKLSALKPQYANWWDDPQYNP